MLLTLLIYLHGLGNIGVVNACARQGNRTLSSMFLAISSTIAFSLADQVSITMGTEREFKEKVKRDDDGGYKVERESKDEFGNKVKEKHEVEVD